MLIIQLVAPTKIQVATFFRKVHPSEKTAVDFEIVSNNDANLFSATDDSNNQGVSAKINTKQRLFQKNGLPMPSPIINLSKNLDLSSVSTLLNLTEIGI
jgi:hypothetical protein